MFFQLQLWELSLIKVISKKYFQMKVDFFSVGLFHFMLVATVENSMQTEYFVSKHFLQIFKIFSYVMLFHPRPLNKLYVENLDRILGKNQVEKLGGMLYRNWILCYGLTDIYLHSNDPNIAKCGICKCMVLLVIFLMCCHVC